MAKRKRKPSFPKPQPYFDSIGSASAGMGVSVATLKWAKKSGCPGFRASRVYRAEVEPWLEANKKPNLGAVTNRDDAGLQKDIEQIRKLRLANDRVEGKLVSFDAVKTKWGTACLAMIEILRQRLEREYPAAVAGLDPAQARIYGKRVVDDIIVALNAAV